MRKAGACSGWELRSSRVRGLQGFGEGVRGLRISLYGSLLPIAAQLNIFWGRGCRERGWGGRRGDGGREDGGRGDGHEGRGAPPPLSRLTTWRGLRGGSRLCSRCQTHACSCCCRTGRLAPGCWAHLAHEPTGPTG